MLKVPQYLLRLFALGLVTPFLASINPASGQDDALPLLAPGTHIGAIYSEGSPDAAAATNQAFSDVIAAGLDVYEVSMYWSMLEPTPGKIDTSTLDSFLTLIETTGMKPYLAIPTIDTVRLALPADLVDSRDPARLASGRHFDDPVILERFNALLDAVVPLLLKHGGFFLAVGNEIDPWLAGHSDEVDPFLHFLTSARDHIHELSPKMGVGVAITYNGIQQGFSFIERFLAESDAAAFTYYPLNADFTVRDPSVVKDDIATMVKTAGTLPVLLQEAGYPSGYLPTATNDSSGDLQRQFIVNMFDAIQANPQIRFVSFLSLVDFSPETCDALTSYYGSQIPQFKEYLCTLGMISYDGAVKPSYEEFAAQIKQFRAGKSEP